jgi:hypothetical protein
MKNERKKQLNRLQELKMAIKTYHSMAKKHGIENMKNERVY